MGSKKSTLLFVDTIAIILSFIIAMEVRFYLLVDNLGSYPVLTTYVLFFIIALIVYIIVVSAMPDIRVDRMSKKEIIIQTIIQQIVFTVAFISIFFIIHRTDSISRIVVGLFFVFSILLCSAGRIYYHNYVVNKNSISKNDSGCIAAMETMDKDAVRHVYIVGSKSIGQYGGFESFVMNLLRYHKDKQRIKYHVACKANGQGCMDIDNLPGAKRINDNEFVYCNAQCFLVNVPGKLGPAQAIFYDLRALKWCCDHIENNHIEEPVVYILASRVGPFEKKYVKRIHEHNGKILQNPDGLEHRRRKWSPPVRRYWKFSEKHAVKNADLVICDSRHIESYIKEEYSYYNPKTSFIAYGSDINPSRLRDDDPGFISWLQNHNLTDRKYYISVGRFVPENNFDIMIREFMNSKSDKDFAIITTENPKYAEELQQKYQFRKDKRIKFVGTVYDAELLKKIRENAYAYFHGHEVGGTNPSLLESLGCTNLNLLLDVGFNREVAEDAAFYWNKEEGSLASLIDSTDKLSVDEIKVFSGKAKQRIRDAYSWDYITEKYERVWRQF